MMPYDKSKCSTLKSLWFCSLFERKKKTKLWSPKVGVGDKKSDSIRKSSLKSSMNSNRYSRCKFLCINYLLSYCFENDEN